MTTDETIETLRNIANQIEKGQAQPFSIEHIPVRTKTRFAEKRTNYLRIVIKLGEYDLSS